MKHSILWKPKALLCQCPWLPASGGSQGPAEVGVPMTLVFSGEDGGLSAQGCPLPRRSASRSLPETQAPRAAPGGLSQPGRISGRASVSGPDQFPIYVGSFRKHKEKDQPSIFPCQRSQPASWGPSRPGTRLSGRRTQCQETLQKESAAHVPRLSHNVHGRRPTRVWAGRRLRQTPSSRTNPRAEVTQLPPGHLQRGR